MKYLIPDTLFLEDLRNYNLCKQNSSEAMVDRYINIKFKNNSTHCWQSLGIKNTGWKFIWFNWHSKKIYIWQREKITTHSDLICKSPQMEVLKKTKLSTPKSVDSEGSTCYQQFLKGLPPITYSILLIHWHERHQLKV